MIGGPVGKAIGAPLKTSGLKDGVGVSAGVAALAGIGGTTHAGVYMETGASVVTGLGGTTHAGIAVSVGVASVTAIADAVKETVAATAGVGAALAVGSQEGAGTFAAAGTSTVLGIGDAVIGKVVDTTIIQAPVDFWLPEPPQATPGKPSQLSKQLLRSIFNE